MDEYQIVERIKELYRAEQIDEGVYFLLNDNRITPTILYKNLYKQNPFINNQVIGYVNVHRTYNLSTFEFPMLFNNMDFRLLYLNKIGYVYEPNSIFKDEWFNTAVLSNLKYFIAAYEFQDRLAIELVDVDVVANNLNLPNIVSSVLGSKLLSKNNIIGYDERNKIIERMLSQKLFAGHRWYVAEYIVSRYFDENKRKLSKEVLKISEAYERVFRPYRVVYNTKTWEQVLV